MSGTTYENMFGFTNDETRYQAALDFREAALADGWTMTATYGEESAMRASTMVKAGFKILIVTRTDARPNRPYMFEASVSIYGPDGLAIRTKDLLYDMVDIRVGLRRCNYCGVEDVNTKRVAPAGRSCQGCITEGRARGGKIMQ